jgi:hypothetical protein
MNLLRWMSVMAGAGALAVVIPATAKAQDCKGNRFATCATASTTPAAMGELLLSVQGSGRKGPLDNVYLAPDEKKVKTENAANGCPTPNGAHGAESVAEHNPHCNGTAGTRNGGPPEGAAKPEHEGPSGNEAPPEHPPENGGATGSEVPPEHEAVPEVTASVTPEPASIVLLGTALLTLGAGAFSRRKNT